MARHPNRKELEQWLDGEQVDAKVDEHVSTCAVCAKDLETITLTASNDNPEPSNIGPALLTLLKPPDDLHERMSKRLAERLQRREDLDLIGSLLGVPRETTELFFAKESDELNPSDPNQTKAADEDE